MTSNRKLVSVNVVDVEKRRKPSKHYVYVMSVSWSDGNLCRIARRFSSFFNMHMALLDKFPAEGGQKNPSQRSLPFLPGKLFFRRSHTRDVTLQRLGKISEYCQELTQLPDRISQCEIILNFFQSSADDDKLRKRSGSDENETQEIRNITGPIETESYIAIADYKAEAKNQLSLHVGEVVEVVDKNDTGWWLVCNVYDSNGFVPGAFLEKLDGDQDDSDGNEKEGEDEGNWYTAKMTYNTASEEEISFPAGAQLEVLQKSMDGWWLVRNSERKGWAPASYLVKAEKSQHTTSAMPHKLSNGSSGLPAARIMPPVQILPARRETIRKQLKPEAKKAALRRLETFDEDPEERLRFVTLFPLENKIPDGLSFKEGQTVEVIEQSDNGWWFVSLDGAEGWVPANYLGPESDEKNGKDRRTSSASSGGGNSPRVLSPSGRDRSSSDNAPNKKPWENGAASPRPLSGGGFFPATRSADPGPSPGKQRPPGRPALPKSPKKQFDVNRKMISGAATNLKPKTLPPFTSSASKPMNAMPVKLPKKSSPIFPVDNSNEAQYVAMVNFAGKEKTGLEDEPWFKDIGRVEAETSLKEEGQEGFFIVRRSKSGGSDNPYSLTVLHRGAIFNFHLRRRRNDGRFATGVYTPGEKTFAGIQDLVKFYSENQLVVGDDSNLVQLRGTPDDYL